MKRTTVTTLVANLRRAIARCLERTSVKATRTNSQSQGTSRIGDMTTTGALCPDITEMTVWKQRLTSTWRALVLSLQGVKRPGNPVGKATTGRNPPDCRVGPLGLLAMTRMVKASCSSSRLLGSIDSAFLIAGIATMSTSLPAAEQDNWYLHGPIDGNLTGVFHQEYNATAKKDMLYKTATGVGLEVRDINGTLLQTINTGGITFNDIEFDQNTSHLFGINASKLTCFEQNASGGWSEQWRSTQSVSSLAQGPSGKLFCANDGNKIHVFEQNGTMSNEFGWVDGINSLSDRANISGFSSDGILVAWGKQDVTGGSSSARIFCFDQEGNFLMDHNLFGWAWYNGTGAGVEVKIHPGSGLIFKRGRGHGGWSWSSQGFWHPVSSAPSSAGLAVGLWLQNGDFISGGNLFKRTFRTKMEKNHNSVPQPVIHRMKQRDGTNILEFDFEVIDTDDNNVTVGILAYCGSDKLVPQAWLNGTGSKIGMPIATNMVHTMEWDVKQDWADSTGGIQLEILCQDGSRDKPVDLHFLKLPFADGNMTISRSPLKESDFVNYLKFLLATSEAFLENGKVMSAVIEGNATNPFKFRNAGVTGRIGPTQAQVDANYSGTNLEGDINMTDQGIQEWTVPVTGTYTIAAWGAQGGNGSNNSGSSTTMGGLGARMKGEFTLTAGEKLKILVGQKGSEETSASYRPSGGGGGTFVVKSDNTKLIIAGGGGGGGDPSYGQTDGGDGIVEETNGNTGSVGNGGDASSYNGGGAGFTGNGLVSGTTAANSFTNGGTGGNPSGHATQAVGGFGGGGAGRLLPGGGGGYSGGKTTGNWSGSGSAFGGGSFNSGANQDNMAGANEGHGKVFIVLGSASFDILPKTLMNSNWNATNSGRYYLMKKLGYRFATTAEVTKAREAATPGTVNNWTAINQVKPRNLPGSVNEYGFDVSTISGFWVIKE